MDGVLSLWQFIFSAEQKAQMKRHGLSRRLLFAAHRLLAPLDARYCSCRHPTSKRTGKRRGLFNFVCFPSLLTFPSSLKPPKRFRVLKVHRVTGFLTRSHPEPLECNTRGIAALAPFGITLRCPPLRRFRASVTLHPTNCKLLSDYISQKGTRKMNLVLRGAPGNARPGTKSHPSRDSE